MKKLFFLLFLFALSAEAQYTEKIDSVSALPLNPIPLQKYIYLDTIRIFADGGWRNLSAKSANAYSITQIAGSGTPGPKGDKGDQGNNGSNGFAGSTGAQGIQGVKGDAGTNGTNGLQGIQGLKGDQGNQGIQGIQGVIGATGTTGGQGIQGLTGSQGIQGATGTTDYNALSNKPTIPAALTRNTGAIVYSAPANGTLALAFGTNSTVKVTPTATGSFTTTVPSAGCDATLIVLTSGTASFVMTFGTGFKSTGTLTTGTTSAKTFVLHFMSDGTTLIESGRTTAQ